MTAALRRLRVYPLFSRPSMDGKSEITFGRPRIMNGWSNHSPIKLAGLGQFLE
jgi:hypothetical protein